jgi:hypothetical protein
MTVVALFQKRFDAHELDVEATERAVNCSKSIVTPYTPGLIIKDLYFFHTVYVYSM